MTSLAERSDLPRVVTLLEEANLCHDDLTSDHMADFIVVDDGAELTGAIGLEVFGQNALLRSLIVVPECRGAGIGVHLLEAIETHARLNGITTLFLLTTTADRFFDHHGYERIPRNSVPTDIGSTTEFSSFCPASAICMRKRLF